MRPCKGTAGQPVAISRLGQKAHIVVLDLDRGALHQGTLERAFEAEHGKGERPWPPRLMGRLDQRRKPRHRIEPCRRDGDSGLRHLLLEARKQRRRSLAHLEQAVPLAHGAVVAPARAAHLRIDGEHQPVEEAAALGSGTR